MKFCKDCQHYRHELVWNRESSSYVDRCYVFKERPDPVSGDPVEWVECGVMRMGPCGMDGKLYEASAALMTTQPTR